MELLQCTFDFQRLAIIYTGKFPVTVSHSVPAILNGKFLSRTRKMTGQWLQAHRDYHPPNPFILTIRNRGHVIFCSNKLHTWPYLLNNPTKQVGLSGKASNLFSDGSRLAERPVRRLFWGFSWQMSQQNLKQPNPLRLSENGHPLA